MFKSWKNYIATCVFASGILFYTTLPGANSCCNAWFPSSCESCFSDDWNFTLDFIWWKPCLDNVDYAADVITGDDFTELNYKSLCSDWTPGVKASIGRPSFYYDWGFIGTYTFIESDKHSSIEGDEIVSPLFHPSIIGDDVFNEASASFQVCYQEWDLLATYDMSYYPRTLFTPFLGVAGIYLEQNLDLDLSNDTDSFESDWDSVYWGVGLRAGAQYQFLLTRCLRFYSVFNATLLAGEADNEYDQTTTEEIDFDDDSCCLFVSGFSILAGFLYDTSFCDVDFTLRLGYEFHQWHNIPNHRIFLGSNSAEQVSHGSNSSTRTLAYHGLFAGIGMTF
jgi:hypothetical protein